MTTYNDVFGTDTVPSTRTKYASYTLAANQSFEWPYNSTGSLFIVTEVMEITTGVGLSLTMPDATEVGVGENTLIRNVGPNTFTVLDSVGGTLGTVTAGQAKLFYITDNSTAAGTWSILTFGTGTSSADATTLAGLGLLAISATLNENHPVTSTATAYTVTTTNRGGTLVFTDGSANCTLPTLATVGNGFNVRIKNNGSGTITLVPQGAETVDQTTLAPGESLLLIAGATSWVTVGYGRTASFAFTVLNKDLTGLGASDVTISQSEAENKIIEFGGTPTQNCNILFPSVASIYYVSSALTTYTLTLKTNSGTSVTLSPGASNVVICDGVNFDYALSSTFSNNISLSAGLVTALPLKFSASEGTGLYLPLPNNLGFATEGVEGMRLDDSQQLWVRSSGAFGFLSDGTFVGGDLQVGGRFDVWDSAGGFDISIVPDAATNVMTFNTTKDAQIQFKWGTLNSVAAGLVFTPSATPTAQFKVGTTGMVTSNKGFADTSYSVQTPITGFSITVANQSTALILTPAGTLATGTITFPAAPDDGQELLLKSTQAVIALTLAGNGKTISAAITTLAAAGFAKYKYVDSTSTWYRVG